MTDTYLVVTPAHGNDYKSKAAVLAAWNSGEDFHIENPGYPSYISNRSDRPTGVRIQVRYAKRTKVMIIP